MIIKGNFNFLKKEFPALYRECTEAEKFVFTAPKYTAIQCRLALELTLNWLFENDPDLERPYDGSLSALLHERTFKESIKTSLFNELNLIRKTGNNAAHGKKVDERQALVALRSTFRFMQYLSVYYSKENPIVPAFDEKLIQKESTTVKTKKELAVRTLEIQQLLENEKKQRENEAELRAENQLLKKQLQQHHKEIAKRKDQRDHEVVFEKVVPELTSEKETRLLYIDLLLAEAGWNNLKKGKSLEYPLINMPKSVNPSGIGYADYVLWGDDGLPLAVIEAKRTLVSAKEGRTQAEIYADALEKMTGQRPIIFYSNGFETYIWDDVFYIPRKISGFLNKEELILAIQRRTTRKDIREFIVNKEITDRYYQIEAVKRVAEEMVVHHQGNLKGKGRKALLVMATGSGKTRTAASIVDMMTKCNWAKRILFLADRNALVTQAKNSFKNYLPHLSSIDLTKEDEDNGTRLVFSTYPTMMNRIDELKIEDGRFYGIGHFDLVVIDEAHRSVYQKYRAIFEYFDCLLLGLTATPKSDIDHNTYGLFDIEDDNPTFAYELNQAVLDKFLVPPKAFSVPVKFVREGIKYKDLSEEDKRKFEETFLDGKKPDEDIEDVLGVEKSGINKFLFNDGTVDTVLQHLMENGIKVNGGDKLGKSIIFAKNHKHALFIEDRFNRNYPQYGGKFLRVIDNYESKAQLLLERFCEDTSELEPQIAVSVDMMDTGVDAPRVVNLVFFKEVRSYTKYWQMIGRGTRLRPNLFGPGKDKEYFLIFDYCGNFEFFEEFPDGVESNVTLSLSQIIIRTKLDILLAIREKDNSSEEERNLEESIAGGIHQMIFELDQSRFEVQQNWALVSKYRLRSSWDGLSRADSSDIVSNLANLPLPLKNDDEKAKRFDILILNLILAHIQKNEMAKERFAQKIADIAVKLEVKSTVPKVKAKMVDIKKLKEEQFWQDANCMDFERVRLALRDLLKFLESESITTVYTNFEDVLRDNQIREHQILPSYTNLKSYKDRVKTFIRKNRDYLVIDKLYKNIPITEKELIQLESFLFNDELGSKEDYEREFGEQPLGRFIRSVIGLDITTVNELFSEFIQDKNLKPVQITFLSTLVNYLNKNGILDKKLLTKPPFNESHDNGIIGLFDEEDVTKIVTIINDINDNAG